MLFCFGLGYSAQQYVKDFGHAQDRIAGTVRNREHAAQLARAGIGAWSVEALAFDGTASTPGIEALLAATDRLLVSVPPDQDGDPVLRHYAEALIAASRLQSIVYLSTVGVYGDHGGAWVDENAEPRPIAERSEARLTAERAWAALAGRAGKALAIFRLSGIYGPGRNALLQVASGSAKRIVKPGQVFNRIHVADIAAAIEAAFARRADGIFNVTDNEPTPPGMPIEFAAALLGVPPPPEVPFAEAAPAMSEMARSFYAESKRVRNVRMKDGLGVRLAYPTYREGLRALFATGEGFPPSGTGRQRSRAPR
jgi:nucleoside-diphosphate-sugar epimerase